MQVPLPHPPSPYVSDTADPLKLRWPSFVFHFPTEVAPTVSLETNPIVPYIYILKLIDFHHLVRAPSCA